MMYKVAIRLVGLSLLLSSCGSPHKAATAQERGPRWVAVVTHELWRPAAQDLDPVPEHRPTEFRCASNSWFAEGDTLEVNTGWCPYVLLSQDLVTSLKAGDRLKVTLWHSALGTPDGQAATGHVVISAAGLTLWNKSIPIPSEAGSYEEEVLLPQTVAAGTPIVLHLHNHGLNVWNIGRITSSGS